MTINKTFFIYSTLKIGLQNSCNVFLKLTFAESLSVSDLSKAITSSAYIMIDNSLRFSKHDNLLVINIFTYE